MTIGQINNNASYNNVSYVAPTTKTEQLTKSEQLKDENKKSKSVQDLDTAAVAELGSKKESPIDSKRIQEMLKESDQRTSQLKNIVEKLLTKQGNSSKIANGVYGNIKDLFTGLEVDDETKAQAQQDISEDGYYGVKQTSERILGFAKALAGGDPSKIDKLYNAVMDGFKMAQSKWGGDLPGICSDTLEAVQKGFDDWRNEKSGEAA